MKYAVNVSWEMFGTLYVEAESEFDARLQADALPLPEGEYISESFRVDGVEVDDQTGAPVMPADEEGVLKKMTEALAEGGL